MRTSRRKAPEGIALGPPSAEPAPSGSARLTGYHRRLFALLTLATFFEGYDFIALTQVMPSVRGEFGLDEAAGGLMVNGENWTPRRPASSLLEAFVGGPGDLRRGSRCKEAAATIPRLAPLARVIRVSGALAYDFAALALGELDARYTLECKPVDFAAGAALLAACGGVVTNYEGKELTLDSTSVIAARSASLHRELFDSLHS